MIRFENVGMRYGLGAEVLRDISFTLEDGSFHFLVGPSGAGKTSLLKLLYLAHRPSRGLIHFSGRDLSLLTRDELPRLRRRIGVVFQDFRLFDHLSAFDNVALPLRIQGARREQIAEHVEELLTWVGLEDRMNARPPTLSGGEKQRIAIARAVIAKPDLLVADEPTGNVDPTMARRLLHLFVELNKLGTTTVVASHDEQLVRTIGAPVLQLDRGGLTYLPKGLARTMADASATRNAQTEGPQNRSSGHQGS
ncbi:cell division ATP-binding protein FtsE [Eilatimonas milleporae]|uniref:Cell division ATP-binding protein FtsE n=1 Tax=Eilatimonas milleporae TaxID=911205 RepID=A0A3M0BYL9_9PROT|nr:cell division ATP-binding protein FtsE [Eilatimonas milleporae]RMB02704.1 cell division transport system ATP-binding protein [Eilatimonas milleporae]